MLVYLTSYHTYSRALCSTHQIPIRGCVPAEAEVLLWTCQHLCLLLLLQSLAVIIGQQRLW